MRKYLFLRNLAFVFIVCNLLFWLFPFPPIVWRLSSVLLSLIVLLNKQRFLRLERAYLFFAAFVLFHFIISFIWQTPQSTTIGNVLNGMLSLSLFSYLSEKGVMTEKAITIIGIILLIASAFCYYYYNGLLLDEAGLEVTTNSYSEYFLMLLPLLLLVKKPALKWPMLMVCLFFLVLGAKRGNVVAAVIPVLILIDQLVEESKRSIWARILTVVLIAGATYLVYNWISNNEYFLYRVEQTRAGDTSQRDELYSAAWRLWRDSDNLIILILGHGYGGAISNLNAAAHSDWLEILVDYGLVGIFFYCMIYFRFYQQIRVTKDSKLRKVLFSAASILFIKSLFSMSFNASTLPLIMISLGTVLGQYNIQQSK